MRVLCLAANNRRGRHATPRVKPVIPSWREQFFRDLDARASTSYGTDEERQRDSARNRERRPPLTSKAPARYEAPSPVALSLLSLTASAPGPSPHAIERDPRRRWPARKASRNEAGVESATPGLPRLRGRPRRAVRSSRRSEVPFDCIKPSELRDFDLG